MTHFEVPTSYPNILLVYGDGVYHRTSDGTFDVDPSGLRLYLSLDLEGCPVSRFSHDFWITHPVGTTGSYFAPWTVDHVLMPGLSGNFWDFRGVVKLGYDLTSLDTTTAIDYFWVLLQEMGHYWLVPPDMTFDGRPVSRASQFSAAFMDRTPYPALELLGRDDIHWSSHMENYPSPMDGLRWQVQETCTTEGAQEDPNILRKYASSGLWPNNVTIPGIGDVAFGSYPDLDKVIMGAMLKENAFASDGNGFYELIPVWVDRVNMLGGLVLVFDEANVVTFGFSGGITQIGISRTGQNFPESWDISSFYKPWEFASRVVFRVVRKNDDYYFQAKQELGNIGCLGTILMALRLYTPPPATDPFEDSETPAAAVSSPSNLQRWTTLKVIQSTTPPIAVGYGCKTWFPQAWVDMNLKPLMLKTGNMVLPSISTDPSTITTITSSYASSLSSSAFVFHRPTDNPRLSGDNNSCFLTMNGDGDNWTNVDHMPKLLVRAPQGDFVAAGSVAIFRSTLAPWAAGAYTDVNLWAHRRKIQMSGLSWNPNDDYRRQNPGRPYKTAFMLIAATRGDITDAMIENLDKLRIAYQTVFGTATDSARTVDTSLS